MNDLTLYLSQLMGPVMAILGLAFLLRQKEMVTRMKDLAKHPVILLISGMVETTAGLAVVLAHNEWGTPAAFIISLMGWGMLIEGTFSLLVSKTFLRKSIADMTMGVIHPAGVVMLAAGAYLSWYGYLVF